MSTPHSAVTLMQGGQHLANMETELGHGALAVDKVWFQQALAMMKQSNMPDHHIEHLRRMHDNAHGVMGPTKTEIEELPDDEFSQRLADSYGTPSTLGPSASQVLPIRSSIRCEQAAPPGPAVVVSQPSSTLAVLSIHDSSTQAASQFAMDS